MIPRHNHWVTDNQIIHDDGFRRLKTTANEELINPAQLASKERPINKLLIKDNLAELLCKPRDVGGPESGFGAQVNRHGNDHDKR